MRRILDAIGYPPGQVIPVGEENPPEVVAELLKLWPPVEVPPGQGLGDDGKDVGSNLDNQPYVRGDFSGDGRRDLPPAPKALQYEVYAADE